MSTLRPLDRSYLNWMSAGRQLPATWPRCSGPLAYGQAMNIATYSTMSPLVLIRCRMPHIYVIIAPPCHRSRTSWIPDGYRTNL